MTINELWWNGKEADWDRVLHDYYEQSSVRRNKELEEKMNSVTPDYVQNMTPDEFYMFLHDEYFVWKYTDPRFLPKHRMSLEYYSRENTIKVLDCIKRGLFDLYEDDPDDTKSLLELLSLIKGLGTAGASGLLAILYPTHYGTVDQKIVKALKKVNDLPDKDVVQKMEEMSLSSNDGVILESIFRNKAIQLNGSFNSDKWTPRRIDMVLWTVSDKDLK